MSDQPTTAPPPGIYHDVPFSEYRTWPYMNNSLLKRAVVRDRKVSMAHLKAAIDEHAGISTPPTKAMQFGSFLHTASLETLQIAARYVVMPAFEGDADNVTQAGKPTNSKNTTYYRARANEFATVNGDREVVSQADFDRMQAMLRSLRDNSIAVQYLRSGGHPETCLVWDDAASGVRMKARVDLVRNSTCRLIDVKTDADPLAFSHSIHKYCYDMQGAIYTDGMAANTGGLQWEWIMVVLGSTSPYITLAAPLHERALQAGRELYRKVLAQYVVARDTDKWPGPANPTAFTMPDCVYDDESITMGGKPVSF